MNNREFKKRRTQFMRSMSPNSVAILPAAPVQMRGSDLEHPYQPDRNFLYLTGFQEPDAVAVIVRYGNRGHFILFCRDHDPDQERWTGPRAGLDGAVKFYGADEAHDIKELDNHIPKIIADRKAVYFTIGQYEEFDRRFSRWIERTRSANRSGVSEPQQCIPTNRLLHEMRLIKSPAEIKLMKSAARISAIAHRRAMSNCRAGIHEFELEAELRHEFMVQGCRHPAYDPIVAGGANACILHYTKNDAVLSHGDLVLIDAAAEYQGYASDITRTFPVNGQFSPPQKAIYELVLSAQLAAINRVRPGRRFDEPHQAAVQVITRGLLRLGLLKGKYAKLVRNGDYRKFFMHRTSHWLGLDVHDVGDYRQNRRWRCFEPGMVLTVEPGIYINAGSRGVARKWWNIGVRIEDDVLVTKSGIEILSKDAPKNVADIEHIMKHRK